MEPSQSPISEFHDRKRLPNAIRTIGSLRQPPSREEIRAAHAESDFTLRIQRKTKILLRDVVSLASQKNLGLNSAAITYNLILSFVPLLAIAFTFFQIFGGLEGLMHTVIIPRIERYFDAQTGPLLSDYLRRFVSTISTGTLGATAFLTLLITVIALLGAIERAFNEIREAPFERPLLTRLLHYWALLTLTPFVVVISAAKSWEALSTLGQFLSFEAGLGESLGSSWLRSVGAFLVESLGFAVLFWVLPARRINPSCAFMGGIVAAIGLESLQWVNSYATARLVSEASLVQLYGSVPLLLVVMLVWLRLVALVLLFGMVVATSWHRVMINKAGKDPQLLAPKDHLLQVSEVFDTVVKAFSAGKRGPNREQLSEDLGLSRTETQRILDWLSGIGLIWAHRSRIHTRWSPTQEALEIHDNPALFCQKALEIPVHPLTLKHLKTTHPSLSFTEKISQLISAPPAKSTED